MGDRYEDEERVLGLRVSELKKLGTVPERYFDQVTFFINLEAKVQDILDLGAKDDHLGRLAYGQDVFNAIYNRLTASQHLKLLAVPWDKCSRENLIKTKDKLNEFREAANMLDKTRADSGEGVPDQDCYEGSPLHLGDEEDVPHQGTHVTTQPVSTCRVCKWSGDRSWVLWLKKVRKFLRPAHTDEKPRSRFHKSAPHARGRVQKFPQGSKVGKTQGPVANNWKEPVPLLNMASSCQLKSVLQLNLRLNVANVSGKCYESVKKWVSKKGLRRAPHQAQ